MMFQAALTWTRLCNARPWGKEIYVLGVFMLGRFLSVSLFVGAMFQAIPSHAWIKASINSLDNTGKPSPRLNTFQRTHVIVLGTGHEFGLMTFSAARLKALKWLEVAPQDQILILSAGHPQGVDYLQKQNFQVQEDASQILTGGIVALELLRLDKIASLEVYSHSNPSYGLVLDHVDETTNSYIRYSKSSHQAYAMMKMHFTQDAFAVLYGCNSGWRSAPILSLVWGIPVAGALTSTEFQFQGRDGNYYVATKSNFDSVGPQSRDRKGFQSATDCGVGCYRMRPQNSAYNGYWGTLKVGLPFFKFFCVNPKDWTQSSQAMNEQYSAMSGEALSEGVMKVEGPINWNQENISSERCLKTMARYMMSEPSVQALSSQSDFQAYNEVVKDFLCPHTGDTDLTRRCQQQLDRVEAERRGEQKTVSLNFMNASSKMAQCNMHSCMAQVVCEKVDPNAEEPQYVKGSCRTQFVAPKVVTTMVDEYRNYLSGFDLLKNEVRPTLH